MNFPHLSQNPRKVLIIGLNMKNEGFVGKTQSVAVLFPYEKREGSSESIPRASNGTGMPHQSLKAGTLKLLESD